MEKLEKVYDVCTTVAEVMGERELDVRLLAEPDKHPTIFARYRRLSAGESFVVIDHHDPRRLRQELDADHAGSYGWEYLAPFRHCHARGRHEDWTVGGIAGFIRTAIFSGRGRVGCAEP